MNNLINYFNSELMIFLFIIFTSCNSENPVENKDTNSCKSHEIVGTYVYPNKTTDKSDRSYCKLTFNGDCTGSIEYRYQDINTKISTPTTELCIKNFTFDGDKDKHGSISIFPNERQFEDPCLSAIDSIAKLKLEFDLTSSNTRIYFGALLKTPICGYEMDRIN